MMHGYVKAPRILIRLKMNGYVRLRVLLIVQEELRRAVGEIAELDPTQTMHDFWAAMDEMASVNTPEEAAECGVLIEQIGGALDDRVSCPICALVFSNIKHMQRHKIFSHGNMFCPDAGRNFRIVLSS